MREGAEELRWSGRTGGEGRWRLALGEMVGLGGV